MASASDIAWFKQTFAADILPALAGTPFDLDMITAIACQETGEIWTALRKKSLTRDQILELCTGDTIDARSAFPKSRAELEAKPRGEDMFDIGRAALLAMSAHIPAYAGVAAKPNKFCHGYGLFQYDIQFFLVDPDYFLEKRYNKLDATLGKCLAELKRGLKKLGWQGRTSLTDLEKAAVAIIYNTGGYKPSRGLKQGHFDGTRHYGENFFDYLRLAHTVPIPGGPPPTMSPSAPGTAIVMPPTPVTASGDTYEVTVESDPLRVREKPEVDPANPTKNVRWKLPDGHLVKAVGSSAVNGFLEIETSLHGALVRGFASTRFLKKLPGVELPPVVTPAPALPTAGIVAAHLKRSAGAQTTRTERANAFSVNEPGMPTRKGTSAAELRAEIAAIIDWLGVDDPAHKRYQPQGGTTFCNIYAHDFCALAGVYLPRVWWNGPAIEKLTRGEMVDARYDNTVDEIRANGLFRWLRDYGQRFGWRQTATLTRLQAETNAGAIGLIVARRTKEGKSGHICAVVPETDSFSARRNAAGEVIAPLQSQAGATNFRFGTSTTNWWLGTQFVESAFWLHA